MMSQLPELSAARARAQSAPENLLTAPEISEEDEPPEGLLGV